MPIRPKPRRGDPNLTKGQTDDQMILLARGLSGRSVGANVPLLTLSAEEGERDLRHMEAFTNACIAYSQQFYIYTNGKTANASNSNMSKGGVGDDGEDLAMAPTSGDQAHRSTQGTPPLIAMPIRIDPEEEKRLMLLRQKIQQGEAQREVLESQYVSLRAQYVYLSKLLTKLRETSCRQQGFLQKLVQRRGALVAIQRVRLGIARDVLDALKYRAAHCAAANASNPSQANAVAMASSPSSNKDDVDKMDVSAPSSRATTSTDLVEIWTQLDAKFKQAEKACTRVEDDSGSGDGGGKSSNGNIVERWVGQKMPKTPLGVPVFPSQLSNYHDFAAAFGTNGLLGSSKSSMSWLESSFPRTMAQQAKVTSSVIALREETRQLRSELDQERQWNRELQGNIISRRKLNDELVAMMTLLRTETEAIVARHNILLESEQARDAAYSLHQEEQLLKNQEKKHSEEAAANGPDALGEMEKEGSVTPDATADADKVEDEGDIKSADVGSGARRSSSNQDGDGDATARMVKARVQDEENDGDDEGEVGEEDDEEEEGEIVEEEEAGEGAEDAEKTSKPKPVAPGGDAPAKRGFNESSGDSASAESRAKRRKV